jgi:glycosyltransferase involved in cell wall biosynthesis
MNVGVIGNSLGIHEARFLSAFQERGVHSTFIPLGELSSSTDGASFRWSQAVPDFLFGGPLHLGFSLAPALRNLPFIAVSYAYDLLFEAQRDAGCASIVRAMLDASQGLLVDCEAVAHSAINEFQFSKPILVKAWGLDENSAPEAQPIITHARSESRRKFTIVTVRNFSELHGVLDVISAFCQAAALNPDIHLIMAGDGPLKSAAVEMVTTFGLSNRVDFLGFIPESQMIQLIRSADLYVSASLVDGTSISLLQAFKSGIPVLLSKVGGNPEWAERANGAALFESGDWRELADLMLKQSHAVPQHFDRSQILARYADWRRNADEIIAFCRSIVSKSATSHY